jgi:putative transposase
MLGSKVVFFFCGKVLVTSSPKTGPEKFEFSGGRSSPKKEENRDEKRHSEEQIIYALRRLETGSKGLEVCREMGISEQTLYNWKRKYGGMGVGELRRLKQLEEENRKLKQLVADLSLDKHILQEVVRKKL